MPPPVIRWMYRTTLTDELQSLEDIAEMNSTDLGQDPSGRSIVKSTLVLSVQPTDGGLVMCMAGNSQSEAAMLTVLGRLINTTGMFCSCSRIQDYV